MKHFYNFVDGKFNEKIKNTQIKINPHSLAEDYSFADSDFLDVVSSVQSAHGAQRIWQELAADQRQALLEKFAGLITANLNALAELDAQDTGIPVADARELCAQAAQRFSKIIQSDYASQSRYQSRYQLNDQAPGREHQLKTPIGIIGIILDWQQSILQLCENLAVSLVCGNLVLLHPSEFSIQSALKLAELASQAGIPNGVLNVLLGRGDELAQSIVEHPGIKCIRFYGENALGEKLYRAAAENNKRLFMSLGANNAAIIFSDGELCKVVQEVLGLALRFHFYGRNKINRILVQEKFLPEFKAQFTAQLNGLFKDQSEDRKLELGLLPSLLHKAKFASYLAQSKKDRAKVLFGDPEQFSSSADHLSDYRATPIVYEDLTNCSSLHQESLAGPILFIQSFKYAHELAKTLNSGSFAHRVYIWTEDASRALRLAQQIEASEIFLNSCSELQSDFSHSSLKTSGLGQEGIEAMFEFNLNKKLVHLK